MNYLAHLLLSGEDKNIKTGNFIADSVKGKSYDKFPVGIQHGIILHREIDHFTDNHQIVAQSKSKFREIYGKHAGIIIDILYDHFLSKNWNLFSIENKSDFISDSYVILLRKYYLLPARIKMYLPFMMVNNWLAKYEYINGIEQVIKGMSMRTSLPDKTDEAMEIFKEYYDDLNNEFMRFFPLLIDNAEDKRLELIGE